MILDPIILFFHKRARLRAEMDYIFARGREDSLGGQQPYMWMVVQEDMSAAEARWNHHNDIIKALELRAEGPRHTPADNK